MLIETKIGTNAIKFSWKKKLRYFKLNDLTIKYDVDVSDTPKHLANFMFGILMAEYFSWSNIPMKFDELTEKEAVCIDNHLKMFHMSNRSKRRRRFSAKVNYPTPVKVDEIKRVEDETRASNESVLCTNGLGRDSLTVINVMKELDFNIFGFTVKWKTEKNLWNERITAMNNFYNLNSIPSSIVETNYLNGRHLPIIGCVPWWIFGLPIAWHHNSNAILAGLEASYSKTRLVDEVIHYPNLSIFSFSDLTKATGINFVSPLHCLHQYGVAKLMVQRYPESIKYQQSCMYGRLWCNKCGKCYKNSLMFSALGYEYGKLGLKPLDKQKATLAGIVKHPIPEGDTFIEVHKKLRGKSYGKWIEQANKHILELTWNKKEITNIIKEHFDIVPYEDVIDMFGLVVRASKWRDWLEKGYLNVFWKHWIDRYG